MTRHPIDADRSDGDEARTDRRRFLVLGGSGILATAVLAACGSDEEVPPGETGVTVPPTETTAAPPQTTSPEDGKKQDAVVTRTMRSYELTAAGIYRTLLNEPEADVALPAPIAYDADVAGALAVLRDRHETHARDLVDVIVSAGGPRVSQPNRGIVDALLAPRVADLTTQLSVLQFAQSLEALGAGTYGWGAGTLTTAVLRQDLMAVGSAAAGQVTAVALLIDPSGEGAVPSPTLDTSGPTRLPDHMLLQEDQDGDDIEAEAPAEGEGGG
jgi:hypothetical protein